MNTVHDFTILHPLGNGKKRKFNTVYLVRHASDGTPGVMKRVLKKPENQHLIPLLRQEAKLSFDKKHLPRTLAFLENEEEIILIRNFQEGIPLDAYWKELTRKEKAGFIELLVEKLAPLFSSLKRAGIVHADIRPGNIIVHQLEGNTEISLIDFGMAVLREKPLERKTLFSLGYSAPELILNKLHLVNSTSDIFSLGICIWQLYAGKLPLLHPNPGIMTNLQITHPLPEASEMPARLKTIVSKMCTKHSFRLPPDQMDQQEVDSLLLDAMNSRYQQLEDVLSAIRAAKHGRKTLLGKLKDIFFVSQGEGKK